MPLAVIDRVNQLGIFEGQPSLIKFHNSKVNLIVNDDTNIAVMYEDPDITLMGDDTDEYPQDEYDTTDVDIR